MSAASGLAVAGLGRGEAPYFDVAAVAALAALVSLFAIAIIEMARTRRASVARKEQTRQAEISEDPEVILARAQAREREMWAKAQTRRFWRVSLTERPSGQPSALPPPVLLEHPDFGSQQTPQSH